MSARPGGIAAKRTKTQGLLMGDSLVLVRLDFSVDIHYFIVLCNT